MSSVSLFGVFQVFLSVSTPSPINEFHRSCPMTVLKSRGSEAYIGLSHSVPPFPSLELWKKISENIACEFIEILLVSCPRNNFHYSRTHNRGARGSMGETFMLELLLRHNTSSKFL